MNWITRSSFRNTASDRGSSEEAKDVIFLIKPIWLEASKGPKLSNEWNAGVCFLKEDPPLFTSTSHWSISISIFDFLFPSMFSQSCPRLRVITSQTPQNSYSHWARTQTRKSPEPVLHKGSGCHGLELNTRTTRMYSCADVLLTYFFSHHLAFIIV